MRRSSVVLAAAAALLTALAAPASAASRTAGVHPDTGAGQAGYYATSTTPFTSISASWIVPIASCLSTNDLLEQWIGLDGYGTDTIEQVGVTIDCGSGAPVYDAWYDMFPSFPVYLNRTTYPVGATEALQATVQFTTTNQFQITLTNKTRGWTYTTTKNPLPGTRRLSAELMVETSSSPLFASIPFTGVRFNGVDFGWYSPIPISSGVLRAGPISGGNAFSVTYHAIS
jgi:hypothetical protein